MSEFVMPSLGADMTEGTLTKWRVGVGDRVSHGDIIAEVETDKGIIEVEVYESGVVHELMVEEGQKVPVGTPMAHIESAPVPAQTAASEQTAGSAAGSESAAASEQTAASESAAASEQTAASEQAPSSRMARRETHAAPLASPAVRRRAHELDVRLEAVEGSGEHGRITIEDVQRAGEPASSLPSGPVSGPPVEPRAQPRAQPRVRGRGAGSRVRISPYARRIAVERGVDVSGLRGTGPRGAIRAADVLDAEPSKPRDVEPLSPAERMQRAIAAAMTRANREIPHYYVTHTIDMSKALDWLRETNASRGVEERLVPGVLVLRAVALALRKHRTLNATWQGDAAVPSDEIHVGLAVSLRDGGLVAPALRNTDSGSLSELMARMTDVVGRARSGILRSSELTSGTITLTALGERGVESVTPIIFPPQVAIVGCGATLERPWAVEGRVVVRPLMRVTLAADHRVSNGHQGARFLGTLESLLQEPEKL